MYRFFCCQTFGSACCFLQGSLQRVWASSDTIESDSFFFPPILSFSCFVIQSAYSIVMINARWFIIYPLFCNTILCSLYMVSWMQFLLLSLFCNTFILRYFGICTDVEVVRTLRIWVLWEMCTQWCMPKGTHKGLLLQRQDGESCYPHVGLRLF